LPYSAADLDAVLVELVVDELASDLLSVFFVSVDVDGGVDDDELDEESDFFDDEYRSAYQPPPLRMKLPPLICRLAVAWWHFGHSVSGASVIFCISSQALPQAVHAYS
jgi:hypothetical protein